MFRPSSFSLRNHVSRPPVAAIAPTRIPLVPAMVLLLALLAPPLTEAHDPAGVDLLEQIRRQDAAEDTQLDDVGRIDRPGLYRGTIPARGGNGNVIHFSVSTNHPTYPIAPSGNASFDIIDDTPHFINFRSALRDTRSVSGVPSRITRHHGTCFGMAFITALWYNRVIRPIQLADHQRATAPATAPATCHDNTSSAASHTPHQPASFFDDPSRPVSGLDGIQNFVPPNSADARSFEPCDMHQNLCCYRMRSLSQSSYHDPIRRAMILHHGDYHYAAPYLRHYGRVPNDSEYFMEYILAGRTLPIAEIVDRIERDGVVLIGYHDVPAGNRGVQISHAMVAYRVSAVHARSSGGATHRAIRVDFYDPNLPPRQNANDDGTYFLYFRDSRQITFSAEYRTRHDLQRGTSVIDARVTRLLMWDILNDTSLHQILNDAPDRSLDGAIRLTSATPPSNGDLRHYTDMNGHSVASLPQIPDYLISSY